VGVSAVEVAEGVRRLLDNPEATAAKGAQARERVLGRYGPERYVEGLLKVYADVLEGRAEA
jgi:glycosyltransferase involved in cell wall biosynthesis